MSSANYFHFLAEILPRVLLLQDSVSSESWAKMPIIIRASEVAGAGSGKTYHPFISSFMGAIGLGMDTGRLKIYDGETQYQIKELHTIEWGHAGGDRRPGQDFNAPAGALQLTRSTMHRLLKVPDTVPTDAAARLIWVTRNLTSARQVLNEAAILSELQVRLKPTPVIEVWRGTEDPLDAVNMFAGAHLVSGPHGAGLTNLIFSRVGTQVVELALASQQTRYFAHLATAMGLPYRAVRVMDHFRQNSSVDVEVVVAAVQAAWKLRHRVSS